MGSSNDLLANTLKSPEKLLEFYCKIGVATFAKAYIQNDNRLLEVGNFAPYHYKNLHQFTHLLGAIVSEGPSLCPTSGGKNSIFAPQNGHLFKLKHL